MIQRSLQLTSRYTATCNVVACHVFAAAKELQLKPEDGRLSALNIRLLVPEACSRSWNQAAVRPSVPDDTAAHASAGVLATVVQALVHWSYRTSRSRVANRHGLLSSTPERSAEQPSTDLGSLALCLAKLHSERYINLRDKPILLATPEQSRRIPHTVCTPVLQVPEGGLSLSTPSI